MVDGERLPGAPGEDDDRIVLHVDMDCFYAACERLREPALRGEPVVVGMGFEPGETRGAVATASYEAREYGIESAMGISAALERLPRRDAGSDRGGDAGADAGSSSGAAVDSANRSEPNPEPDPAPETAAGPEPGEAAEGQEAPEAPESPEATGYYRPVDMEFYESVAADVKEILHDCADVVRAVSIDEAYLDVTDRTAWAVAEGYARHVKDRIAREVGVTASVGVAPTMSAAKIASDHDKPDGLVVIEPGSVSEFLAPLDVEDLHGIGPVTAGELRGDGIETIGELADADQDALAERYGERGRELSRRARGIDPREVTPVGKPKSLSRESAFADAVDDPAPKREKVRTLARAVADRARRKGALYRTIGIKAVEPPYDVNTRAHSLPGPVDDPDLVEEIALSLLEEFEERAVRKLGVRVANLSFAEADQADLDGWATDGTIDSSRAGVAPDRNRPSRRGQTTLSEFE